MKTNKNLPIEFKQHSFLKQFLEDTHNRIVLRKCTQIGASFSVTLKILHLGSQAPLTFIYTLPTGPEAKNFVLSKFDPVIERSEGLLSMVNKVVLRDKIIYNSVVKRIGDSYYFFRGSWTTWGAQSIDADVLVVDELDFQKPDVKEMWEERVEGADSLGIIYWVGYPSIPGFGIEELYESSDQRNWFIECGHCHKRQTLTWPDSIDLSKEIYQCKFCAGELSDKMRSVGLWKATKPKNKAIHGYYINKLMAPWISASNIVARFKKDTPKKFYNFSLGLPYVNSKTEITDKVIENSLIDEIQYSEIMGNYEQNNMYTFAGVDQGDTFHILIGFANESFILITAAETATSEEELEKKLSLYNPDIIVMDAHPNRHTARKMCEKFGHDKFFMASERLWSEVNKHKSYYNLDRSSSKVGIERTESFDMMMDHITNGVIKFRRSIPKLITKDKKDPGVYDMIRNLVPDIEERYGKMRRVWKRVGEDHYGHCLNFLITGVNIMFPGFQAKEFYVPSSKDHKTGITDKPWYVKDFEKRVNKLAGNDTIIIKPTGETIKIDDGVIPRVI